MIDAKEALKEENLSAIFFEMGHKDTGFSDEAVQSAANVWKTIIESGVKPVYMSFGGFDDDPRELWEIPEVNKFVYQWVEAAGVLPQTLDELCTKHEWLYVCYKGHLDMLRIKKSGTRH